MDEHLAIGAAQEGCTPAAADLEDASAPFLGRWHRLVSTTNWEKGRILCEWRRALIEAEAPASLYSDEAWSQRAGGVSAQHVGRLRRVFERFGGVQAQYPGLYWSHFLAALDWDDAEMWLEGAVQNGWSVARMRAQRADAMGAAAGDAALAPLPAETDEDAASPLDAPPDAVSAALAEVHAADADELGAEATGPDVVPFDELPVPGEVPPAEAAPVPTFAGLPAMPDDLAEAFEAFKLAILNHKLAGFTEISRAAVVQVLDALRRLALAEE